MRTPELPRKGVQTSVKVGDGRGGTALVIGVASENPSPHVDTRNGDAQGTKAERGLETDRER
jgi:hypothetical protein